MHVSAVRTSLQETDVPKKRWTYSLQIQLIRIELRVPEYGWTTQKVFHLMNFIVNGGMKLLIYGLPHMYFYLLD